MKISIAEIFVMKILIAEIFLIYCVKEKNVHKIYTTGMWIIIVSSFRTATLSYSLYVCYCMR